MPSNIEGKLYLGDILLCDTSVSQDCPGPYSKPVGSYANFDSIKYDQYINNNEINSSFFSVSYQQLYVYNSG